MQPNDLTLVNECLNGNKASWGKLIDQYAPLVYSIPRRNGLSHMDAEEVFQNVFTIAFRQLSQLRNIKTLPAWLITVTYHETIRVSRNRNPQLELTESLHDPESPPIELVQKWERQHAIRSALDQLQSPCKELLRILFLEDPPPSYDAIAQRLGMPKGSIGPTRGRCLKRLEEIILTMGIDLD